MAESGVFHDIDWMLSPDVVKQFEACQDLEIPVRTRGWAKQFRLAGGGKLMFIHLGDGSSLRTIQVVYQVPPDFDQSIHFEASIEVEGVLIKSPAKGQAVEIKATKLTCLGDCDPDEYPFPKGKKALTMEYLRSKPHLRPKTSIFSSTMRLRHGVSMAIHQSMDRRGFFWIHTPIITSSDCEGAGEMFRLVRDGEPNYFREQQGRLTVSGQLHVEPFACSMGKVYTFGPTFRAEKSITTRHLSEFWMIEPEQAFIDLEGDMDLAEGMIKDVLEYCLRNYSEEIAFCAERFGKRGHLNYLAEVMAKPFRRMTYSEAITHLQKAKAQGREFEKPCEWGVDLGSDQEKYLSEEVVGGPVFLTHYPRDIKSFYMYQDDPETLPDGTVRHTVACMDLLVPGIGELIGGSQREHRLDVLKQRIEDSGMDPKLYEWYMDTRRFGTVVHSGFGIGFDRLLRMMTGAEHIFDVVPYPVRYQHLSS